MGPTLVAKPTAEGRVVTFSTAVDLVSGVLGITGSAMILKGPLRLGLGLVAVSLFMQVLARSLD
ncbi:hypothetical protein [Methylocella silvestris]|uniref:hypothetical protein n=1 Tax=Methylocella silvestris TaxID=199596 RepID=UPI00031740EB|nr:hypothetical protein [Methylocella silvestris]